MKTKCPVRHYYLLLTALLFSCIFAETGWRDGEMEVKVYLKTDREIQALHDLQLQGDIYRTAGYGIMYVTPGERVLLENLGFDYAVIIADLNAHYRDFWNTRNYSTYAQIIAKMNALTASYPHICKKFVFGTSVNNRELSALKISDNVATKEYEPKIIFDGGIHGNEVGGPENMILFAEELCSKYGSNPKITELVNNTEIWIYCMVNPDGRVSMSRHNANRIDLNRNYGYMTTMTAKGFSEPETKAIRNCLLQNQFSIQISYHSGIEYILYPWGLYSHATPDKAHHELLCRTYASTSGYNRLDVMQSYASYHTTGETLDYAYGALRIASMTMEISYDKQPADIIGFYNKNVNAMLAMIEYAGYGLKGIVTDQTTREPVAAVITVGAAYPVYTDPEVGDYHKYVRAGTYSLHVRANGYKSKTVSGVSVVDKRVTATDIQLEPEPAGASTWGYKVVFVETGTAGITPDVLGSNDGKAFTLRSGKELVIDMQYAIRNRAGSDFKVYSTNTASYTFYAGQTVDGPWRSLGTGTGTREFDLEAAPLAEARYVKITGACAVDAVEALWDIASPVTPGGGYQKTCAAPHISLRNRAVIFTMSTTTPYTLGVYDIQGKLLWNTAAATGREQVWNAPSPGIFFARVTTGEHTAVKGFSVIR